MDGPFEDEPSPCQRHESASNRCLGRSSQSGTGSWPVCLGSQFYHYPSFLSISNLKSLRHKAIHMNSEYHSLVQCLLFPARQKPSMAIHFNRFHLVTARRRTGTGMQLNGAMGRACNWKGCMPGWYLAIRSSLSGLELWVINRSVSPQAELFGNTALATCESLTSKSWIFPRLGLLMWCLFALPTYRLTMTSQIAWWLSSGAAINQSRRRLRGNYFDLQTRVRPQVYGLKFWRGCTMRLAS